MADGLTIEIDVDALLAALDRVGAGATRLVRQAAIETGTAIVWGAQARVPRDTGTTQRGIHAEHRKNVVAVLAFPETPVTIGGRTRGPVDLWIEAGTRRGKPHSHTSPPRPFFYPAVEAEESRHVERVRDALARAILEAGF